MDLREIETHGAFAIALIALGVSIYNTVKDRRVLAPRVEWRWEQGRKKLLTVFVTNLKPRPVWIRWVILEERDDSGKATRRRLWREGTRNQTGRLTESEYLWADFQTSDWASIRRIYAIDSNRKEWDVPKHQLRSIRSDSANPKGEMEI